MVEKGSNDTINVVVQWVRNNNLKKHFYAKFWNVSKNVVLNIHFD